MEEGRNRLQPLRFSSTAPHPDRRTLSSSCGILKVSVISAPKTRCGWEREGASIVDEASHWTNRFRHFWKDGVLFPRRPFRVEGTTLRCPGVFSHLGRRPTNTFPSSLPNPWPLATSNWDTRTSATFHKSESYRKLEEDAMSPTEWQNDQINRHMRLMAIEHKLRSCPTLQVRILGPSSNPEIIHRDGSPECLR